MKNTQLSTKPVLESYDILPAEAYMKKKILVVMLMIAALSGISATPLFQVGPLVAYKHSALDLADEDKVLNINSYGFGADARVNLFDWVSIDVPAVYSYGDGVHTIGTSPSLNLNIPAAGFIDIALGLAMNFDFQYDQGSKAWYINGEAVDKFSNAFMGATLAYRLALTLNFGFLSVGASASVPMEGNFQSFNGMPSWADTRVSVALLFNFL